MDEILEIFRKYKEGDVDSSPYTYENINVVFAPPIAGKGFIHIFNFDGKFPYGHYPLPKTEEQLSTFLQEMADKVVKLEDSNKYICYKCHAEHDLPPAIITKDKAPYCPRCKAYVPANEVKSESEPEKLRTEDVIKPKDDPRVNPKDIESAIKFLRKNGYKVNRMVRKYKVVYNDTNLGEKISTDYYKNEADFAKSHKSDKFISLIKELYKEYEESLD
jgi:DNA-directed RNA polymerase subunit RPC12/RpoP